MVCPPVGGYNPRALARVLYPPYRRTNHDITILYHLHKCILRMKIFVLKFVISCKGGKMKNEMKKSIDIIIITITRFAPPWQAR